MNTHDIDIELPPLPAPPKIGFLSYVKHRQEIERYGQDCMRVAIEADRQRRGDPVAWSILDKRTGKHWYTHDSKYTAQHYANEYSHRESDGTPSMVVEPLYAAPQPAEPVNGEELLAAREALIDMGYLWDGDQWVEVDPPSKTAKQAPEWPDFARMEAGLQRLKERLVFENGRRKDLEQRLQEKRNG